MAPPPARLLHEQRDEVTALTDSSYDSVSPSASERRDNNPFTEAFSFEHFYTGATDNHHHSARVNARVPENWLHYLALVAANPKMPQYDTTSAIIRDGIAKALKAAVEIIDDPNVTAGWTTQLAIIELEAKKSADDAELRVVELWGERLRQDHGWTQDEFARDQQALKSPEAVDAMLRLSERHRVF